MIRSYGLLTGLAALSLCLSACSSSAGSGGVSFNGGASGMPGTGNVPGSGATGGGATGGTPGGGGSINIGGASGGGGTSSGCSSAPTQDQDGDGFTGQDGDCNDCDKNANPGAFDVPGNNVDEDCNGTPDDTAFECDQTVTDLASNDAMHGAWAIGLCQAASAGDKKWGVLEAKYVQADGSPINPAHHNGHGLLTAFGPNVNVQEGKRMLALSSGTARQPTDPGYQSVGGYSSGATSPCPTGFPIESPTCNSAVSGKTANDPAGLELKIRVPTNAKSLSFNFNFYSYEWPSYVCTMFNDFFVALLDPANNPQPPQYNNISFDSVGNPVSVNNGLLDVCSCSSGPPCTAGGKSFPCALGANMLQGTGFEQHAATGWLETVAPVTPGSEITLRYAIWDAGDHILDSSVLIDNFKFSADEATGTVTKPVPVPK